MDRKEFLRNSIAAAMGAVIGAKLDWVAPVSPVEQSVLQSAALADVPGTTGTLWSMNIQRGMFAPYEIIMSERLDAQYYLSRKSENVLLATPIDGNGEPFELHEVDAAPRPPAMVKLCSAYPESST